MTEDEHGAERWLGLAADEVFELHFARWRVTIAAVMAWSFVVGVVFYYLTDARKVWIWLLMLSGAYVVQAMLCRRYERGPPAHGSHEFARWAQIWTAQTVVTGLISGTLIFCVPADQFALLLAAVLVSATYAIGEAAGSGHQRLIAAGVISQTLMTSLGLVIHAHEPQAVLITVPFALVLLYFGLGLHRMMQAATAERLRAQYLTTQVQARQEQLLAAQHQQSVQNERQRVMQDMHDGLGSELSSSLVLLERGNLNVAQAAEIMRDCIIDLRLVVDSLEPTSRHLATLLGKLRYRLQHRFAAGAIQLHWEMADLPEMLWLDQSRALDLLRITQEAISNALQHSSASELRVVTRLRDESIELLVADNGRGFEVGKASTFGHGLRAMHQRARRLGADLTIDSSSAGGTRINILLPIETGKYATVE